MAATQTAPVPYCNTTSQNDRRCIQYVTVRANATRGSRSNNTSPPPSSPRPLSSPRPPSLGPISSPRPTRSRLPPTSSPWGTDFSGDFLSNHKSTDSQHKATTIGIVIGTTMLLMLIVLIVYCLKRKCFRKKDKKNIANIKAFLRSHDLVFPREYSYWEIKKMTNFFAEKLGQGGFGGVYKGKLPDGRLVAVKVLSDSKSNGEDFINEVSSISRTSHVNIVSLLGFCYKPKRVLIYEYMSNGSLDKLIYNQGSSDTNSCQLEWKMLYEIALGIARGLEYLHRGCNTRILHFDIKPHNILLDDNFCAKIADFGLAKLSKRDQSTVSVLGARGTRGYIAPEVCSNHFGRVSFKSDVYSYGMMVLEMVGKRKNMDPNVSQISRIYFPHYIYKHVEASRDLDFDGIKSEEEEEIAKKMILVSLWCIQTNPSNRPSMSGVIEMLQSGLQSLPFPPNPFLSSPTTSPEHSGALD
ncbi:LEAF RUST 10 DISEASE-RESISTANCE LOCUS RECEPTOR-LIKE PROTEIN KINASE-like 2.1 [Morus notabilis]|uniref:LEAF RUST 10 DISEASE-RESISTANCE LOCUS RECEPTOR-LIKE PROTEIN KINASE-like 2.1 n=1 Tax=Morus notabilis TaxID=981085 RepID=UPI000CED1B85|nr:LEAF RUST 10 DISEASE-RESISTANCE LOCUS RECEPTOR-LIKE PROTEIN KINASE-like 2.1 [Morus notabilis]